MFDGAKLKYIAVKKAISQIESAYWTVVDYTLGGINDSTMRKNYHHLISHHCEIAKANNDWDEFTVVCDETNNPPDYIERGCWPRVEVHFKILKTQKNTHILVLECPDNLESFLLKG